MKIRIVVAAAAAFALVALVGAPATAAPAHILPCCKQIQSAPADVVPF